MLSPFPSICQHLSEMRVCARLSIFVRNVPFDAEEGDLKEASAQ